MTSKPNKHGVTGIAFGYIGAHVLDPDVVDQLLYGVQAKNLTYEAAKKAYVAQAEREHRTMVEGDTPEDYEFPDFDQIAIEEKFAETYEGSEESIAGCYESVHYESSWMGGALHFFIYESPHVNGHAECSPCVPGAGDLHNDGEMPTYDVPNAWRA